MRLLPIFLLIPLTLSGCYFSYVDGENDWDDDDWADWENDDESRDDDDSQDDDPAGEDEPIVDYSDAFSFSPDYIVIGDMQVLEIGADPDLCAAIARIDIEADIEVHAVDSVGDEIRIALTVADTELPGTSDVTFELDDGTIIVLADALDVLTPEEAEYAQDEACE